MSAAIIAAALAGDSAEPEVHVALGEDSLSTVYSTFKGSIDGRPFVMMDARVQPESFAPIVVTYELLGNRERRCEAGLVQVAQAIASRPASGADVMAALQATLGSGDMRAVFATVSAFAKALAAMAAPLSETP